MRIKILAFGKIAEILSRTEWEMEQIASTEVLRNQLETEYPALKDLRYLMAVDKKIVAGECVLEDGVVVALLPPFSGG
jgi:molybdopterin synthase sulfur carrier subunit